MKNLILSLFLIIPFIVCSCATTSAQAGDPFKVKYDDIKDVTYINHEDLNIGVLYNLRDSLTGERENIRLYIANDTLFLSANYQYSNWAFFDSVVFIGNGGRVQIPFNQRTSHVVSAKVVREQYDTVLNSADIAKLEDLLNGGGVQVAFVGNTYTTDKLKMSDKVNAAFIAMINKYKTL